jgi:hypothetical protein
MGGLASGVAHVSSCTTTDSTDTSVEEHGRMDLNTALGSSSCSPAWDRERAKGHNKECGGILGPRSQDIRKGMHHVLNPTEPPILVDSVHANFLFPSFSQIRISKV